jgi:hypothetical protein
VCQIVALPGRKMSARKEKRDVSHFTVDASFVVCRADDFTALLFRRHESSGLASRAHIHCSISVQYVLSDTMEGCWLQSPPWHGPVVDFLKQMVSRRNFCGREQDKKRPLVATPSLKLLTAGRGTGPKKFLAQL